MLALVMAVLAVSPLRAQEERGYLGINLSCDNCRLKDQGDVVVWWFSSPPRVNWVREGGPAALAGLRPGDVILEVAGVDITSEEGGRRFGSLKAGVPVEFKVRRGEREATVVVTPGTSEAAFGREYARAMLPDELDSVKLQLKTLYERQLELQLALKNAERILARAELQAQRESRERRLEQAKHQRAQIDSMRRQLEEWHKQIRVYTDSLAARTLYLRPRLAPQVEVTVPRVEVGPVVIYSDAVAGARFKELNAGSPLLEYFPGVKKGGLLVTEVVPDTPAHSAGLREGDVVVAVGGEPVRTVSDLRRLLRGMDEAELTYVRKGKTQTCKIPSGR